MNCKDCINNNCCKFVESLSGCALYKDKSQWVKLPFPLNSNVSVLTSSGDKNCEGCESYFGLDDKYKMCISANFLNCKNKDSISIVPEYASLTNQLCWVEDDSVENNLVFSSREKAEKFLGRI